MYSPMKGNVFFLRKCACIQLTYFLYVNENEFILFFYQLYGWFLKFQMITLIHIPHKLVACTYIA